MIKFSDNGEDDYVDHADHDDHDQDDNDDHDADDGYILAGRMMQ